MDTDSTAAAPRNDTRSVVAGIETRMVDAAARAAVTARFETSRRDSAFVAECVERFTRDRLAGVLAECCAEPNALPEGFDVEGVNLLVEEAVALDVCAALLASAAAEARAAAVRQMLCPRRDVQQQRQRRRVGDAARLGDRDGDTDRSRLRLLAENAEAYVEAGHRRDRPEVRGGGDGGAVRLMARRRPGPGSGCGSGFGYEPFEYLACRWFRVPPDVPDRLGDGVGFFGAELVVGDCDADR